MYALKMFLILLVALALPGCGLMDKKIDPNYELQLNAYNKALDAKKAVEVEKAKTTKSVQVLSIKGKDGQPMIMSGVSEISVSLPSELFEKGGMAEVAMDKLAATMPSLPVEQPSFLEKAALMVIDKGLAPGIMMWGNVTQSREQTKQAESTNSMWRDIILGVGSKPAPNVYNYSNSYNQGDNQGTNSGGQRNNAGGNYGTNSGDNRENPNNSVNNNNQGNDRNNTTCVPTATTRC